MKEVCKVISNGRHPILMRPAKGQVLPRGPLEVIVNGRPMTAWIVKIACNMLTERDNKGANKMGETLRGWFGEDAGKPGRKEHVQFREEVAVALSKRGSVWVLEPVTEAEASKAVA